MPANPNVYDPVAAGWGATAGLRESAFIDEFGSNGLKFSICQSDFSASMKLIGDTIAKKLQNLCVDAKLLDNDTVTPGLQPDCRVVYLTPVPDPSGSNKPIFQESASSLPVCPAGATSDNIAEDCWQLASDTTRCPAAYNGQLVNVLRTTAEIAQGPLVTGTRIRLQCRICSNPPSADQIEGCNY
jgi:hypothetical protein